MSKKRKTAIKPKAENDNRIKYGNAAGYILWALIAEVLFCLICGWISGDTSYSKISDNFVTGMLQNYNYILGMILLIPVITYIFSRIKLELKSKFLSDNQILRYGFYAVVLVVGAIIAVCGIIYPINSSTYYGINSVATVGFFMATVTLFILECLVLAGLKLPALIKEKGELKNFIKKYLPIILLVMFIIWVFISCLLAPQAADDVIGAEAAKEAGASPSEVLSKTFNGCYNLKDGFWAFLMYGSVLISSMLICKESTNFKKRLIIGLVAVITVLSIVTLIYSLKEVSIERSYNQAVKTYNSMSGELGENALIAIKNERVKLLNELYGLETRTYIYTQRGVFRNSNHFAYVLCIAVIAALVLAMEEKNYLYKALYLIAFGIMTAMLIVNDTFGGYLGVMVALVCILVYLILNAIFNRNKSDEGANNSIIKMIPELTFVFALIIFSILSFNIKDKNNESMAIKNINNFNKDIGIFGGFMLSDETSTSMDIEDISQEVKDAGSLRGQTWIKVLELVKQRPWFGYGLECLLFQFSGQFGINEGRTHNLLLQLLGTVGIPGTIMYFAALGIIFVRLLSHWKEWDDVEKICAFVGISYIVTALTGNSTYYTSPYFMMFLGFVALTQFKKREKIQ